MDLITRDYHIALFDIYKELLTAKQQEYFVLHYFDDFSFSEISEELNVSRNAPFDQIKKVVYLLEEYENKLKLYQKKQEIMNFSDKLDQNFKEELLSIIKE